MDSPHGAIIEEGRHIPKLQIARTAYTHLAAPANDEVWDMGQPLCTSTALIEAGRQGKFFTGRAFVHQRPRCARAAWMSHAAVSNPIHPFHPVVLVSPPSLSLSPTPMLSLLPLPPASPLARLDVCRLCRPPPPSPPNFTGIADLGASHLFRRPSSSPSCSSTLRVLCRQLLWQTSTLIHPATSECRPKSLKVWCTAGCIRVIATTPDGRGVLLCWVGH